MALPEEPESPRLVRALFFTFGLTCFALGAIGVVVPGLPTTPFMILAAWAFARSSKRFHDWLYHHRLFGPPIQRWREHRVIPLAGKLASATAMIISLSLMLYRGVSPTMLAVASAGLAYGAWFIWRCPSKIPEPSPAATPALE